MPGASRDFSLFEREARRSAAKAQTNSTNGGAPPSAPGVIPPGGTAPSVAPGTPAPDKPATEPAKPEAPKWDSYLSVTGGFALGPAYWATLSFASDNAVYLSLNSGSGLATPSPLFVSGALGVIPSGNANSVLSGPGGSASGGMAVNVGAQRSNGGDAVEGGLASKAGGVVGMGYGFKIYDGNRTNGNPQVFRDKDGKILERCY